MKEARIIRKIKRLLRQARMPTWLHRFGPKKYKLWQHMLCLLIREECQLSFRRVHNLLDGLGFIVPTYSALCKMSKRIPVKTWRFLLWISAGVLEPLIAAIDATFYNTRKQSQHYLNRTKKKAQKPPIQATALRDVCKQKWLAVNVHNKQVGEAKQAKPLLERCPRKPKVLTADKAYDAEHIHEYAHDNNILTQIPVRKNVKRGFYRRKMTRRFNLNLHHRRVIIESGFSSTKRRSGSHLSCRYARTRKAQLHARYSAQNLELIQKAETFN